MTRLGYVRNRAARSTPRLAGAIALVFCEEAVKALADPFFVRMVRSLSKVLASADLQLILLTLHSPREYYTVSRYLRAGHVDGALLVSMHSRPDFDFAGLGIPLVLCGRPVKGGENLSYIDADNVDGARNGGCLPAEQRPEGDRDHRRAERHGARHRPAAAATTRR